MKEKKNRKKRKKREEREERRRKTTTELNWEGSLFKSLQTEGTTGVFWGVHLLVCNSP